jgi:acyl-coenzyme A synthetase/AMP-(fatty) acid ligase
MTDNLLALIRRRREAGFQVEAGGLSLPWHLPSLQNHGPYLVGKDLGVTEVWEALAHSLERGLVLVLLPPGNEVADAILLRQLPAKPPASACLTLFTSGSTGTPKAVLHGEGSLLASASPLALAFPHSRTASLLPAWGMAGVAFHLLLPLRQGELHLCAKDSFLYEAGDFNSRLKIARVELVTLNPYLLEMWERSAPAPKGVRVVSLTAPLPSSLREKFCAEEIYGMSEAAGPVLHEGKLLGAKGRIAPSGELELQGEQLFLGYGSEGIFFPSTGWFATGDQFAKDEEFRFLARTRDLIEIGGRKIAPALVEEVLREDPNLAEVAAFEKKIEGIGRIAFVYVRRAGCDLSEDELAKQVSLRARTSFSVDMRPAWWGEKKSLPRLPSGKIDREKIRGESL